MRQAVLYKWIDIMNIELACKFPKYGSSSVGYDSDEDLYFENLNKRNFELFKFLCYTMYGIIPRGR
jgi:hypothetical protein